MKNHGDLHLFNDLGLGHDDGRVPNTDDGGHLLVGQALHGCDSHRGFPFIIGFDQCDLLAQ